MSVPANYAEAFGAARGQTTAPNHPTYRDRVAVAVRKRAYAIQRANTTASPPAAETKQRAHAQVLLQPGAVEQWLDHYAQTVASLMTVDLDDDLSVLGGVVNVMNATANVLSTDGTPIP